MPSQAPKLLLTPLSSAALALFRPHLLTFLIMPTIDAGLMSTVMCPNPATCTTFVFLLPADGADHEGKVHDEQEHVNGRTAITVRGCLKGMVDVLLSVLLPLADAHVANQLVI
ncbi:hypothetical protein WOLCODRAFT_159274 [Wolfiporia cocos MD-104 SS10]|uniref:Uncharacterized protein n=1 Tax=Wolfiporia cocos (strain MD-104) TaxID=742152 RepID=A0A2H3JBX3_WOLCO|nr:hypothetical protein WOLCODRAFT_159274 [Wolfiporia cocos MD-104 SS10]